MPFTDQTSREFQLLDAPIRELRLVTIHWVDDVNDLAPTHHFVHEDHVNLLVGGLVKLHGVPAFNPHARRPASRAKRITVGAPSMNGPYWWTGPELGLKREPGAGIINFGWPDPEVVWERPEEPEKAVEDGCFPG